MKLYPTATSGIPEKHTAKIAEAKNNTRRSKAARKAMCAKRNM